MKKSRLIFFSFVLFVLVIFCFSVNQGGNNKFSKENNQDNLIINDKIFQEEKPIMSGWVPNGLEICNASGLQEDPEICSDGAGGAIIAWYDKRGGDDHIYVQGVNADGTLKWTSNGVLLFTTTTDIIWNWGICTDGAGGAIVLIDVGDMNVNSLYANRINSAGNVLWGANGRNIINTKGYYTSIPQICSDGAGGAFISWQDERQGVLIDPQIYVQRINSAGTKQWGSGGRPATISDWWDQNEPSMCPDGEGGVIVAWEDYRAFRRRIYAQRLDSNGNRDWGSDGTLAHGSDSGNYLKVKICSDQSGGAVLTWKGKREGSDSYWDLFAQRLDDNGIRQWGTWGVQINTGGTYMEFDDYYQQICSDNNSGAYITWTEFIDSSRRYDISAQHIDENGIIYWGANGKFICDVNEAQYDPQLCGDGKGGVYITWYDFRDPYADVFIQLLNASGDESWDADGFLISKLSDQNQRAPKICEAGQGAIIAWEGFDGIGAQYISPDRKPIITINYPFENERFGTGPPYYKIDLNSGFLDKMWYTLDGGLNNYSFSSYDGRIIQSAWDSCGEGSVTIRFYANNTLKNIGSAEVTVLKDYHVPSPPFLKVYYRYDHDGIIELNWTQVDGATSYYVYRETSTIKTAIGLTPIANRTVNYYMESLPSYDIYYYAIVASNSTGNSTISNIGSAEYITYYAPIHIDNNNPNINWNKTASEHDWLSGSGTCSDPYLIENLVIDAGGVDSGILIENSNEYFKIKNCTITNSGDTSSDSGIKLSNTNNGTLINNTCYNNQYTGIALFGSCKNNTIIDNKVYNNEYVGISLPSGSSSFNYILNNTIFDYYIAISMVSNKDNIIADNYINGGSRSINGIRLQSCSGNSFLNNNINNTRYGVRASGCSGDFFFNNTINNTRYSFQVSGCTDLNLTSNKIIATTWDTTGLYLYESRYINLTKNNFINCGVSIGYGDVPSYYSTHNIDTTNKVNGKILYYYLSQTGLGSINFDNAGQIILVSCTNSEISNRDLCQAEVGITLFYCDNNNISGNIVNQNSAGIYLFHSDNNIIYNNTWHHGNFGILLISSNNNNITDNKLWHYGWFGEHISEEDCTNNYIIMNMFNGYYTPLIIDDDPSNGAGDFTWAQFAKEVWCSGSGSLADPYTIKNLPFGSVDEDSSVLTIRDSDVYFKIENCTAVKAGFGFTMGGITLNNVNNGLLIKNNCSTNGGNGICLTGSSNNIIFNNTLNDNYYRGILLGYGCGYNEIFNNTALRCMYGIYIYSNSDNNTIYNNFVNACGMGILLDTRCINNTIENNTLTNGGGYGLRIEYYCDNNTIRNNTIKYFSGIYGGIYIYDNCDNNTIEKNTLFLNRRGIYIREYCRDNYLFNNTILNSTSEGIYIRTNVYTTLITGNIICDNGLNGFDDGVNNMWNNSKIGNYWGDYPFRDLNDDGIGDIPYSITGSAIAKDYLPIWDDGKEFPPYFINEPDDFSMIEGYTLKNITWTPKDLNTNYDSYWILRNNTKVANDIWDGSQIIYLDLSSLKPKIYNFTCFVNDTNGFVNSSTVFITILKDIQAPNITIVSPTPNQIFGNISGTFELEIEEYNLNITWYSLNGGLNYTFEGLTGKFNQTEWDLCGNGTIIIRFYANDTNGNLAYKMLNIYKDCAPPEISIISPKPNTIFNNKTIDFEINIIEANLNTTWYRLFNLTYTSANITFIYLVNTSILQSVWNEFGNGTMTIRFYANDTFGNEWYKDILIRKDITIPNITIKNPKLFEFFNLKAPDFNIIIYENSLNTTWYILNNGTKTSDNIIFEYLINTSILQNVWDDFGNGTITIRFYANDTFGNIGYEEVTVRKDIFAPDIAINDPKPLELFGKEAPDFDILINEANLNTTWYMLYNSSYTAANTTFTYLFDISILQSVWDDLGNGTITIRFYANDTAGNIAYEEVTVRKDIFAPDITINDPKPFELFGKDAPDFDIIINEANLNTTWYMLYNSSYTAANTTFTYLVNISILQSIWDDFGNGTITIKFYANDTAGNIAYEEVTVRKDIIAPDIVINDPKPLELFGKDTPDFDIIINEANLNTTWYYLTDGFFQTVNVSFIYLIDTTIMQSIWNQVNGEFITIYFYANDSMGNVDFQSITIKKLADYWVLSPFVIDNDKSNGAGDYNWTEATAFDWCNGSGTIGNPYFIGNLYINGSGLGSCLTIRDTSKFFIVNNSIIFNSGNGDFDAGIKLINANNGTISYNNFSLNQNGIVLRNSNNNTIFYNTVNNNANHGIAIFSSSYNKILYNNETIDSNVFCGIFLNNSHYNNITGNFIRYNDIGICLNSSNYNTITYNLFIGNNQDIVQNNCIKNFIGINYHEPVPDVDDGDDNGNGKGASKEKFDNIELLIGLVGLIIIISIIGIIIVIILVKRGGSGNKKKKEKEKILDILHDIR